MPPKREPKSTSTSIMAEDETSELTSVKKTLEALQKGFEALQKDISSILTRQDHLDKQQAENKNLLVEHKKLLSKIETISKDNSVKDEKISELELRIDH